MQLSHIFHAKSWTKDSKDISLILSDFLQIMAMFNTVKLTLPECQELCNNACLQTLDLLGRASVHKEGRLSLLRGTSNYILVISWTKCLEFQKGHFSLFWWDLFFTLTAFSRHSWFQVYFSWRDGLPVSVSCSGQESINNFDNSRGLSLSGDFPCG